jgi:superfamily II RNA helicase
MATIPNIQIAPMDYPPKDPAITYSFPLDPWQQHAVSAIHRDENVLVTAKTGSGKTLVGEYQIAYSRKAGQRVFYTTPIKSLSNQKFYDLKRQFPDSSVGIMTGDIKFRPDADIVIMTTEILRNLLYKANTSTAHIGTAGQLTLTDVGAVIFDEVHYINDPDRGHVWEESLCLAPPAIRLILLSATMDAPEEFASWLQTAKAHPITLLKTSHRIVPLIHGIFDAAVTPLPLIPFKTGDESPYNPSTYANWLKARTTLAKDHDKWKQNVKDARKRGESSAGSADKIKLEAFPHRLNQCIETLSLQSLLPALFFAFSRRDCELYAAQVTHDLNTAEESAAVKHILDFHLHRFKADLELLPQYHKLRDLLQRGIAFHHSGVLPLLKEAIEILFARGFVKILFCTETFAVGLNMPTRTAVFLDLKKPSDGGHFRPLRTDEYIQMAGRAGRRGKDTRGIVLYLPARIPLTADELSSIYTGGLVPLQSRLQFHYEFLLKAIHRATADDSADFLTALVGKSYWQITETKARQEAEKELHTQQSALVALQSGLTIVERDDLDLYDTLKTTILNTTNAAKRAAQAQLEQWKSRHMGPKWLKAVESHAKAKELEIKCRKLQESIDYAKTITVESRYEPVLKALEAWKALSLPKDTKALPVVTEFGKIATEFNEGNPLLLAQLYSSKKLHTATAEDIVNVLAAFITDRESEIKTVHPRTLPDVSELVKTTLLECDTWGQQGVAHDTTHNVKSPETFWSLTTLWVQISHDWLHDVPAAIIAKKYEIYEGNLMRGLHKLASLVNEWIAVATMMADVEMLHTLRDIPQRLMRDIAIPESLYLTLT